MTGPVEPLANHGYTNSHSKNSNFFNIDGTRKLKTIKTNDGSMEDGEENSLKGHSPN